MIGDRFRVLLTVLEEGSLSAAAQKLGYTPSGVSRMMASLEEETGVSLLIRGKNGVAATEECERLLPTVRNIVYYSNQYDQIAADINGLKTGTITVGTSYGSFYRWMVGLISRFKERYPQIDVRFIYKNSSLLTQAVQERKADVAIVSERPGRLKWIPLCEDPMMAWVPEGSPYAAQGFVPVEAFAREPYIEPYPDEDTDNHRILRERKIVPNTQYAVNDTYAAYCLVEAGLGITMMNNLNMGDWSGKVKSVPIHPETTIQIGLVTLPEEERSPALGRFIRFIRQQLNE